MKNKSYNKEYIEDILRQISPPINKKVSQVSKETGVSTNTIYGWKRKARIEGKLIPNSNPNRLKRWRKEDKLKIVMETFTMNEEELSRYC
ncbi:transposase, partial [Clostridiisalibacter paucivorans]|uniref:transposase n=5 Tax=Clostridiisalibacter paucivorans TaxID=408753 RepID=UPI00047B5E70